MPAFDRTISLSGTPTAVSDAIQSTVAPDEQFVTLRPNGLLIALRGHWGYIYILSAQTEEVTRLRLIVDTVAAIRGAFQGKSAKEALTTLLSTPPDTTGPPVEYEASQHLDVVRQRSEEALKKRVPDEVPAPREAPSREPSPRPTTPARTRSPWNPDQFGAYLLLISPIVAGIVYALNWRRLGKREWVLPTLALTVLLPLGLIGILILAAFRLELLLPVILVFALLWIGASYGLTIGLGILQRGAYKHWSEGGDLADYTYNIGRAALISVLITGGVVAVASVVAYVQLRPNTFESDDLVITYPSEWAVQNIADIPQCQGQNFECVLVLADARFGFTWITVGKFPVFQGMTAEDLERQSRSYLVEQLDATLVASDTFLIDGEPAARRYYRYPVAPDDLYFGEQIYIVRDGVAYEITAESLNEGIFREHQSDIDEFIEGIDFQ